MILWASNEGIWIFPSRAAPPAHELPSQLPDSTTVLRSAAALLKQFARSHPPTPPSRSSPAAASRARVRTAATWSPPPSLAVPFRFHHRLPRDASDYYRDGTRGSRRTKLLLVTMAVVKGLWSRGKRLVDRNFCQRHSIILVDLKLGVLYIFYSNCDTMSYRFIPKLIFYQSVGAR